MTANAKSVNDHLQNNRPEQYRRMNDKQSSKNKISKNRRSSDTVISNQLQKVHRLKNNENLKANEASPINQQLTIDTTVSDGSYDHIHHKLEHRHQYNECCIRMMSSSYDSDDDNILSKIQDKELKDTLYNTDRITNIITPPTSSQQSKDEKPIFLSKLHDSTVFLICNLSIYSILGVLIRYLINVLFYSGCEENGKFACVTSAESPIFIDLPANSK